MSTSYNRDAFADLMGQLALQAQEGSTTFTGGGFGKSNVGMQGIAPGGYSGSSTTPAGQAAQAAGDPYAADPDFRFYDSSTYNVSAGSPLDYYIQNPFGQSIGDTYSFIGPQPVDFTVPTGGTGVGTTLTPSLNFDSLGGNNVEEITVTGSRGTDPNVAIGAGGMNLNLGNLNLGDTTLEEEDKRPIEEIVVTGVKNAANTLIPGLSLMSSGYDFIKELPEGDFTPDELAQLEQADTAANVFVDSQPTYQEGGTGTTAGVGGVNVPGLGIGSLGGSRGFVGTQDVLVPAIGQMGDIYSIRPGDTRGRFAAPAYVNPYADVAAQDTAFRPGFVPTAPIAAAPGTAVTPTVTQPTVTQPTVTQPTVTQPTVTQPADNTDFYTARDTNNTGQTLTVNDTTGTVGEAFDFLTGGTSTVLQPTVTQPPVTQPTVSQPTVTETPVTQPQVIPPTVTQPTVSQPTVTETPVTQPQVIPPTVTQPPVIPPTVIGDPPDVMTPREILDSITSEDGFSRDEQQQIADLLSSGEIGIGNVMNEFDVGSGDVVEGLLRGGFQTPEQVTEMIRGYGNEGFQEQDLIADLLNQGRTTPEEVAGYYSANRPEFADLTPEAVTGYLNEINMDRLQNLSDVEVGKLIDSGEMTPGQAVEIYQSRYPGLTEADVMASLNQMKSQGMFAMGGVVEKADGIESLLDKRQQAVNRMLSRRAVAQFRNGGPVVKKPLAPANFAGGGIATKLIQKGAEMLGFDDARQIEITREAVDLTNQMVDAGLVDPKFRVKLRLPESGEQSTRQNTGIEGDEEVFNAVNHALFSYHAGKSPLARAGSQAKEIYQGMRLGLAGKDPGSESLDYFNNMFGFDLARQGLSPEEAKSAIIDNIANIDNKGALSRLRAGEPLIAGKDLSRTAEDIRGSGPDVSAFDVLAGVQGFKDGGAPEKVPSSVLTGKGSFYGTPYREEPKVDTGETNLTLQQRLDQATPLEQYAYEVLGLEPGLDRGMITPVAIRQSGDKEFALPALAYDSLKALLAPGAALSGRQVTPEETIELAMETMGSGLATPGVDIGTDVMAGMATKPKGGVFAPMRPDEDPFSPEFTGLPSHLAESGAETIPANYANTLINLNDMDEELAMGVAKRAENYFKKLYGTGEDPIRIKILEGEITPNFSEELTPELLEEARRDYARFKRNQGGAKEDYTLPPLEFLYDRSLVLNNSSAPKVTPALEAFEILYDNATGIRKEVNFEALGVNDMDPRQKIIDSMIDEGVPPELITPAYDPGKAFTYMDVEEYTPFLDNPSISRALETGEPIYDIDPSAVKEGILGFLTPEQLSEGIATLPPNKLKNMSFPDIIANVQKSGEAQEIFEAKNVAEKYKTSGEKPSPDFLLKKGVEKVDDFGNEGWYRITKPVYTKVEGLLMDHSVGGYYDKKDYNLGGPNAFKTGKARIFSLRNNQTGEPRLTVEIDYRDPDRPKPTDQMKGPSNSNIQPKDYDKAYSLFDELGVFVEDVPDYMQEGYRTYKEMGVSGMDDYFGPPDV